MSDEEKIAGLLSVYSRPKSGGSPDAKRAESYRAPNGVTLAKWEERHGEGYTTRTVYLPSERIPVLVTILMERYLVHLADQARAALKQVSR